MLSAAVLHRAFKERKNQTNARFRQQCCTEHLKKESNKSMLSAAVLHRTFKERKNRTKARFRLQCCTEHLKKESNKSTLSAAVLHRAEIQLNGLWFGVPHNAYWIGEDERPCRIVSAKVVSPEMFLANRGYLSGWSVSVSTQVLPYVSTCSISKREKTPCIPFCFLNALVDVRYLETIFSSWLFSSRLLKTEHS